MRCCAIATDTSPMVAVGGTLAMAVPLCFRIAAIVMASLPVVLDWRRTLRLCPAAVQWVG